MALCFLLASVTQPFVLLAVGLSVCSRWRRRVTGWWKDRHLP